MTYQASHTEKVSLSRLGILHSFSLYPSCRDVRYPCGLVLAGYANHIRNELNNTRRITRLCSRVDRFKRAVGIGFRYALSTVSNALEVDDIHTHHVLG